MPDFNGTFDFPSKGFSDFQTLAVGRYSQPFLDSENGDEPTIVQGTAGGNVPVLLGRSAESALADTAAVALDNYDGGDAVLWPTADIIVITPTADIDLTGMVAGKSKVIINGSATFTITVKASDGGSDADKQFGNAADVAIAPLGVLDAFYVAGLTKWIAREASGGGGGGAFWEGGNKAEATGVLPDGGSIEFDTGADFNIPATACTVQLTVYAMFAGQTPGNAGQDIYTATFQFAADGGGQDPIDRITGNDEWSIADEFGNALTVVLSDITGPEGSLLISATDGVGGNGIFDVYTVTTVSLSKP